VDYKGGRKLRLRKAVKKEVWNPQEQLPYKKDRGAHRKVWKELQRLHLLGVA